MPLLPKVAEQGARASGGPSSWVLAAGLALAVAFAAFPCPAAGQDLEPNDSPASAAGPLVGGERYAGVIETPNDVDHFYFNVAGQRQVTVSLSGSRARAGCDPKLTVRDGGGYWIGTAGLPPPGDGQIEGRLIYSTPASAQYVIAVEDRMDCDYSFQIDPADAVVAESPGVVVTLHPTEESDDLQRVYLGDALVGVVRGGVRQSFTLGRLEPDARIRFEAENGVGRWSWRPEVTDTRGRVRTTILAEDVSGGVSTAPRIGIVRQVVVDATGVVLSTCGEALAPATCFPMDRDGDGVPGDRDCDDANPAVHSGAAEIPDNTVDENCDGVVAIITRDRDGDGFLSDRDCNDGNRMIHPGAVEILGNAIDEDCDHVAAQRRTYGGKLKLWRRGTRYLGVITSAGVDCVARRPVLLRRAGRGRRTLVATVTARNGTFVVKRSRRLRGRIFAVAPRVELSSAACRATRSRGIRG